MEFAYIMAGAFAVVAVVVVIMRVLEKKRAAALEQVALEMGFHYEHDGQPLEGPARASIQLFQHGHSQEVHNVLRGRAMGSEAAIFDHQYTVGYGRNEQIFRQSVAAFRIAPNAPVFQLCPENFMHRLGSAMGYQDIDFDGNPEFSRRYLLRGPDEAAIRMFFNPGMLAYLESLDRNNKWHVEAGGGWIVLYVHKRRRKPQDIRLFLDEAQTLCAGMKANAGALAV